MTYLQKVYFESALGYFKMALLIRNVPYLDTEQLLDTTFWLKPWLKSNSLAPTFSIWLKCWLQQIMSQG